MVADFEPLFTGRPGWRRIYPDLPGMGRTPADPAITAQDQMLDAVLAFIDAVAPGERFVVAGTSYGGHLARGLVHRRGDRLDGVALIVPVVETDLSKNQYPPHQTLVEAPAFLAALGPDERDMLGFVVAQSPELLEGFRANARPAFAIADYAFLERLAQQYAFTFDVGALPAPFPAPTLILTGRQDSLWGYREAYRILDGYPRATYATLDCAGHMLSVEQQALFRALVGEWLDRIEEYAVRGSGVVA
jgi:pimeloyl-ACP methyl ester carboxylesterase